MQKKRPLAVVSVDAVLELWKTELTREEICRRLGISEGSMRSMKEQMQLPHRPSRKSWHAPHLSKRHERLPEPDLAEEEVLHRKAQVQARWTDQVFEMRATGRARPLPYEFPVITGVVVR